MRPVQFERNYIMHPAGSCLASFGDTKVLCCASIENSVPSFLRGKGTGWITAEYSMMPGSTGGGRKRRDGAKKDGRSVEIQRLIGRSLRAAVDMEKLGEVSIVIDCDVMQADGGTRTTGISGGYVALYDALRVVAQEQGVSGPEHYLKGQVAAVSVGVVKGEYVCDLDYINDSQADVDMNVVMLGGDYVEVQGTGEEGVFNHQQLNDLLASAKVGIEGIYKVQNEALGL
ncbi:MAG: ribonuclease PH [Planctomycetes bacterium]|nr:ribonuclease PH [Planctomycetota bacterium]